MTQKRKYRQITDEIVENEICADVELGLSTSDACDIADVSYETFLNYTEPKDYEKKGQKAIRKPEWRASVTRARKRCKRYWLNEIKTTNSNARVHAAEFMLGALDPDTYREKKTDPTAGWVINFLQAGTGELIDTQVIMPKVSRGKQLQLKQADIPPASNGL